MSTITPLFQDLLNKTARYPDAMNPIALHGFLTALAIGPEEVDDYSVFAAVYGTDPNQERLEALGIPVWDAMDEIADSLADFDYQPLLQGEGSRTPDPALWMRGFNQAVNLAQEEWSRLNDENLEAGKKYAFIQTLAGPEQAELIFGISPDEYTGYVAESLPYLPDALEVLFQDYWGDEEESALDLDLSDLPGFEPEVLQQLDDDEIVALTLQLGDLLPREVVDEAIRRGEPMAARLRRYLESSHAWDDEADDGEWWGLLHAALILGQMSTTDATQGLLQALKRLQSSRDDELCDWLSGYWPALFRNKRAAASAQLQTIAADRGLDWYPRNIAQECLLEAAHAAGADTLEQSLQRIAVSVADETEDWSYRMSLCQYLLDFPREANRKLLQDLALQQTRRDRILHFTTMDVELSFDEMQDDPEWLRFEDPLEFYDPHNIVERQLRWSEEEDESLLEDDWLFDEADEFPYEYEPVTTPYVRETPKVGRNDPCPCGSGKKYKKCCLKKLH